MTYRPLSVVFALASLLAGCSTVNDPFLQTASIAPDAAPLATEVSPEFAVAYLPGVAGGITAVRQSVATDGLKQDIVYANTTAAAGENVLTVDAARAGASDHYLHAPTERQVRAEMRQSLPGIAMTISPEIGENLQGVYGYATGSFGTGGSCLYAWQLAKDLNSEAAVDIRRLGKNRFAAQIRLRYCSPSIPQDRIAALMKGLRVKPVTDQTLSMLRFANGSGIAAAPKAVASAEPVARPKRIRKVVTEEVAAAKPVVEEPAIKNAAVVPLPDAGAKGAVRISVATVDTTETGAIAVAKPVTVPLPTN